MSKTRYRWWGYVKAVIRAYPELCARLSELKTVGVSQHPDGGGGHTGRVSRPTEAAALRTLPPQEQRELDAVRDAVETTRRLSNGEIRLAIIRMVYWQQSHTLDGAAREVGYSYGHAKRMQEQFCCRVAENLNLKDEPQEPKNRARIVPSKHSG